MKSLCLYILGVIKPTNIVASDPDPRMLGSIKKVSQLPNVKLLISQSNYFPLLPGAKYPHHYYY